MSNKSPIESTPCGICTGWLRCKAKAIACWAQERLEFLCERDAHASVTQAEQLMLSVDWDRFHAEFAGQVISERCMKAEYGRDTFADWLVCATDHGFVASPATLAILRGRLTAMNKIGLLPTIGLSCMCCAGYRVWAALVLGIVVGCFL